MGDIYDAYNDLKNDSMEARYQMRIFSDDDITGDMLTNLEAIKAHVLG